MTGAAPLALTMGDAAGVGGEITVAAWRALRSDPRQAFFAIDCPDRLAALGAPTREIIRAEDAAAAFADALPVLPERLSAPPPPGRPTPDAAAATIRSIERAVGLARHGAVAAVVTNPINKHALQSLAGFAYPGHTEFLAALCGAPRPVMLLAGPSLRVVPVTIHVPLAQVPALLSPALLAETLRIVESGLRRDFGVAEPRIAVAGLNPHAGENGALGREEIELITPTLDRLRGAGMRLAGPLSADTMFHPAARERYDVAVCMYHDQALIPVKMLDFARGVNVTLGLPFIRTSPDHGTAYDIAGRGVADPTSLIEALNLAAAMAARREAA